MQIDVASFKSAVREIERQQERETRKEREQKKKQKKTKRVKKKYNISKITVYIPVEDFMLK